MVNDGMSGSSILGASGTDFATSGLAIIGLAASGLTGFWNSHPDWHAEMLPDLPLAFSNESSQPEKYAVWWRGRIKMYSTLS